MEKRKIGIVGFGHLGQYLVEMILSRDDVDLAFVWNRTPTALVGRVDKQLWLEDLDNFAERNADLIVEVAHPSITQTYGEKFLQKSDYLVCLWRKQFQSYVYPEKVHCWTDILNEARKLGIGSPTAMADPEIERKLRKAATAHGLYVPSGALWGGEDIRKMADRGTLQALKITMKKPPESFKLEEPLKSLNDTVKDKAVILYDGSVRGLCPLAPNNVNTMAAAAVAAHNLGFDKTQGSIVADPSLTDWHVVEIDVWGPGSIEDDTAFHCQTTRRNPAKIGKVTGSATYASFLSSLIGARGKGPGVHLC